MTADGPDMPPLRAPLLRECLIAAALALAVVALVALFAACRRDDPRGPAAPDVGPVPPVPAPMPLPPDDPRTPGAGR